jgi:hypothetical protein
VSLGVMALPLTLSGSVIKILWPFRGSASVFRSDGAPFKPTGERYNSLIALLREHCLFWEVVKLLR